jgi:peroxiredoxin
MKSAEELGLEPTKYGTIYTMRNSKTGEELKVGSDKYMEEKWWEKTDYKILQDQTETVVLEEGYEPPVHDFVLTLDDEDITDKVLTSKATFLLIAYKIDKTEKSVFKTTINDFAYTAEKKGIQFLGLSASLPNVVEEMRHELQTPFPFASADETTLKTIIRSNPGIVLLKDGVVVKKWHYNDLPIFEIVEKEYL